MYNKFVNKYPLSLHATAITKGGKKLKGKIFGMMELSAQTCRKHDSTQGFASNKTLFLLQEYMQGHGRKKVWTVKNHERDRFGLLNGILWLTNREEEPVEFYFGRTEKKEYYYMVVRKTMSFKEVSQMVDSLYMPIEVYYA